MFDFLKKKREVPDVGQEEEFDKKNKGKFQEIDSDSDTEDSFKSIKVKKTSGKQQGSQASQVEFSRVFAKLEALDSFSKALNERLSNMSQQLGEIRAMNLNNEKSISRATQEALKTIDIVREVKPENLRSDYQKIDLKVNSLSEQITSNRQFLDTLMNEVKDIRRKAGIFVGTDALLKLNEEVKRDLIELQKVGSRVRANAEKSEQIFIGLKKEFAETQKNNEIIMNLDNSYSELTEKMEKLRVDLSKIVKDDDFYKYRQMVDKRLLNIEGSISEVASMKQENERLARLIENTLAISKRNKENIGELAVVVGNKNIEKVSDYEERFSLILKLLNQMAGELKEIKGEPKPEISKKASSRDYKPIGKKNVSKAKEDHKRLKKVLNDATSKDSVKIENIEGELKSLFEKSKE